MEQVLGVIQVYAEPLGLNVQSIFSTNGVKVSKTNHTTSNKNNVPSSPRPGMSKSGPLGPLSCRFQMFPCSNTPDSD